MDNTSIDTRFNEIMNSIQRLEENWESIDTLSSLWEQVDTPLKLLGCNDIFYFTSLKTNSKDFIQSKIYQLTIGIPHNYSEVTLTKNDIDRLVQNIELQSAQKLLKSPSLIPSPFENISNETLRNNLTENEKIFQVTRHDLVNKLIGYTIIATQKNVNFNNDVFGHTLFLLLDSIHEKLTSLLGEKNIREIKISPREKDVLHLLIEGKTNNEIATALTISPYTISSYISVLTLKLGTRNRTATALKAINLGLVKI